MKKFFTVLLAAAAILVTTETTLAQEKGWWLGGQIGFWHDSDGYDDYFGAEATNTFSISPEVGYDFNKHWSVGLALGFDYLDVDYYGSASVITFSPYARWNYLNKGILSLFLDGGFAFAFNDIEGFQIGITPGLSLRINDHFTFLTHIGFLGYRQDYFNGGGEGYGFKLASRDLKFGFYYKF